MAEPSVAVNTPFRIPPITMIIKSRLGRASHSTLSASLGVTEKVDTYPLLFAMYPAINIREIPQAMPGM